MIQNFDLFGIQRACYSKSKKEGEQLIKEHGVSFILSGELEAFDGQKKYFYRKGDLIVYQKNALIRFVKYPHKEEAFQAISVVLDQATLQDVAVQYPNKPKTKFPENIVRLESDELIQDYFLGLDKWFNYPKIEKELVQLKKKELIYLLLHHNKNLGQLLFTFTQPGKVNLESYMNSHFRLVEREGIYLCWNALLCVYNQQRFKERNVRIDCITFKQFIARYHPNVNEKEVYYLKPLACAKLVQETLAYLEEKEQLPDYDYMIIDEAQDLFDRNLALLIDKLCGDGKGLTQGNVMLLYDLDQSFSLFGRDVTEYAYFLKDYFTHFKLHKVRRSAQKSQIRLIAEHIQEDPEQWEDITVHQAEYDEIELRSFDEVETLKLAIQDIIDSIQDPTSSLEAQDVIILVQSKVWQRRNNVADLIVELKIEELTPANLTLEPTKLQYTTALKYKGLERKNVILIVDKPDQFTPFEWYVGCTRAIDNLNIWQLHTYEEHEE